MKAKEQQTTETENLEEAIFTPTPVATTDANEKRAQILKAIQYQEYPRKKSKDIIGETFDLIDAVRGKINDDEVVTFIIRLGGNEYSVSKPLNAFTATYLSYFESFGAGETIVPMTGYTFVELEEGGEAGNKPVTLRKQ